MARIYNKTTECRRRHDESYATLLAARNGERFEPSLDVWRLEFELKREALSSLKLAAELDTEDADADIEAELSAEELPHVGTLPKLFAHLDAIFQHLSYHWLRLVQPARGRVRSRWPLDPTWQALRAEFAITAAAPQLDASSLAVVRGRATAGAIDCSTAWRRGCSPPLNGRMSRWPQPHWPSCRRGQSGRRSGCGSGGCG
jgi:hypothetical protein